MYYIACGIKKSKKQEAIYPVILGFFFKEKQRNKKRENMGLGENSFLCVLLAEKKKFILLFLVKEQLMDRIKNGISKL